VCWLIVQLAVTVTLLSGILKVHEPVPLQVPPDHPENVYPVRVGTLSDTYVL